MDKIGVGIVGLGDEGICQARSLAMISSVRIVAACEVDLERSERGLVGIADGVTTYRDHQNIVTDSAVELVIVATPDHTHLDVTAAGLAARKHVFVEKPVATAWEDLREFKRLAELHRGRLWFSEKYSFAYPIEAALWRREQLGEFLWGSTLYTMWRCGRIMGGGKWRTESRYNPCAGGLSHNFMTALLFARSPIAAVRASGQVFTYHENLDRHGGFDTMEGTLHFTSGAHLNWVVCLAVDGAGSSFGHRTVAHTFQFRHGALVYGSEPRGDRLILNGIFVDFALEPFTVEAWDNYNIHVLHERMQGDLLAAIRGESAPRHTIEQGINVAAACVAAFDSAHGDGGWIEIPLSLR